MARLLRRLVILALLGVVGGAAFTVLRRRKAESTPARLSQSEWPMLERRPEPPVAHDGSPRPFVAVPVDQAARWLVPEADGQCPPGYPIKANDNSGIFHVPGGRFYDRTIAERCYADAADAEADGYRRAKA